MRTAIGKLRGDCVNCGQRFCVCGFRPVVSFESKFAGGVFGGSISVGCLIEIELYESPWTARKIQILEALIDVIGSGLDSVDSGNAVAVMLEIAKAEPEHDEGGWVFGN